MSSGGNGMTRFGLMGIWPGVWRVDSMGFGMSWELGWFRDVCILQCIFVLPSFAASFFSPSSSLAI